MNPTPRVRGARRARLFREVTRAIGRRPHQRVCPLPLACVAIALPFLAAWATAATGADVPEALADGKIPEAIQPGSLAAANRSATDPWAILDRTHRQPVEGHAYVDLYGPLAPWEQELIVRQGYVSKAR